LNHSGHEADEAIDDATKQERRDEAEGEDVEEDLWDGESSCG
jgi:hypothetical protein